MKVIYSETEDQIYLLPYIKITHNRILNGHLELIIGWLKWEIVIAI